VTTRRSLLSLAAGLAAVLVLPRPLAATPDEVREAIAADFGAVPPEGGDIRVTVPPLAESGNAVPLGVEVPSPMTPEDHVTRIAVYAEANPYAKLGEARFGPASPAAWFETSIRLAGTQDIVVVAETSTGAAWAARARVVVVVGACTALSSRY
jgi:sulfur-oxidizing protein SoxY